MRSTQTLGCRSREGTDQKNAKQLLACHARCFLISMTNAQIAYGFCRSHKIHTGSWIRASLGKLRVLRSSVRLVRVVFGSAIKCHIYVDLIQRAAKFWFFLLLSAPLLLTRRPYPNTRLSKL